MAEKSNSPSISIWTKNPNFNPNEAKSKTIRTIRKMLKKPELAKKIVLPVRPYKPNNENPINKTPVAIIEKRFHLLLTVSHFLLTKS